MLLCETPGKYKRHGSGVFDVATLEDLKLVVDNSPVLYLDEIQSKLLLVLGNVSLRQPHSVPSILMSAFGN